MIAVTVFLGGGWGITQKFRVGASFRDWRFILLEILDPPIHCMCTFSAGDVNSS